MKKKLIAILLLFSICLAGIQMPALAADSATTAPAEEEPLSEELQQYVADLKARRDEKEYDAVIEDAEAFLRKNPDSPAYSKVEKICIQCYIRKGRDLINDNQREAAWNLFEEALAIYEDSPYVGEIQKDFDKLKKLLKDELPKSGQVFHNRDTVHGGAGKLVINNSGKRMLVKIEKASGSNKGDYITVFVRSDGKASVNIQPGNYTLKYARGDTWYGTKEWFGSETEYYVADTTLEFAQWPYYSTWTWTLGVTNGNLSTTAIDADDF